MIVLKSNGTFYVSVFFVISYPVDNFYTSSYVTMFYKVACFDENKGETNNRKRFVNKYATRVRFFTNLATLGVI